MPLYRVCQVECGFLSVEEARAFNMVASSSARSLFVRRSRGRSPSDIPVIRVFIKVSEKLAQLNKKKDIYFVFVFDCYFIFIFYCFMLTIKIDLYQLHPLFEKTSVKFNFFFIRKILYLFIVGVTSLSVCQTL